MSATMIDGRRAVTTGVDVRKARAAHAEAVIEELLAQRSALYSSGVEMSAAQRRDVQVRQVLIAARLAAWWRVLARTRDLDAVPEVYLTAVFTARYAELDRADRARDRARYWAERAAQDAAQDAGADAAGSVR